MGQDVGDNYGANGILDIAGSPLFYGRVLSLQRDIEAKLLDAAGRGDGEFPEERPDNATGAIILSGEIPADAWPLPVDFNGVIGTITLTFDSGKTEVSNVRVLSHTITRSEKTNNQYHFKFACRVLSHPDLTGFDGAQPQASPETFDPKELWSLLFKGVDPKGIQSNAKRRLLLSGVGDNDSAEITEIQTFIIAAVAPFTNLKLRLASFSRKSSKSTYLDFTWGLTDTQDDIINPETEIVVDPKHNTSQATTVGIDDAPPTPTGDAFVARETSTAPINDEKTKTTKRWGLRDTQDDEEMPRTQTSIDPLDIKSNGAIGEEFTTADGEPDDPTPASGQQITLKKIDPLNRIKSVRTTTTGKLNSQQEISFEKIKTDIDLNNIVNGAVRVKFYATGSSAPTAPDDPPTNDVKEILSTDFHIVPTIGAVAGTEMRLWVYGPKDSADELILPNFETEIDAGNLKSIAIRAALDGSSITDPADFVLRTTKTKPVTIGLSTNRTLTIKLYGLLTSADEEAFAHSKINVDASDLKSIQTKYDYYTVGGSIPSPPAPPSGYKYIDFNDYFETQTTTLRVWLYGKRTNADDAILGTELRPQHFVKTDANGLEDQARQSAIDGSPSVPGGQKLIWTETYPLTLSSGSDHTMTRIETGQNDSKDLAIREHARTEIDPDGIDSIIVDADVTSSTGTSAPTHSGFSLRSHRYTLWAAASGKYLHVWVSKLLSSTQEIEVRESSAIVGPLGYEYEAATIDDSTDDPLTHGTAIYTANKADVTFENVRTRRINLQKVLGIIKTTPDSKLLKSGSPQLLEEALSGIPDPGGGGFGNDPVLVKVWYEKSIFLVSIFLWTDVTIRPIKVRRMRTRYRYMRRIVTDTPSDFYFTSQKKTVNDDTFLGFAAHSMMYIGHDPQFTFFDADAHLLRITYEFEEDDMDWFSDTNLFVGRVGGLTIATGLGNLIQADTNISAQMIASWPDTSDFSVFGA